MTRRTLPRPPHPHPAAKHKAPETSFSPQLPNICSPWPARKKISSKGAKGTFFFLTYPLSPVSWSLEDQAGRRFWTCYVKNIFWGGLLGLLGEPWCLSCCYLFVSYTLMAFSAPSTSANFPGLGWQKAASLRTVYCSGYSNGVIVIKRQKAKIHSQIKQKAKDARPSQPP